MPRGGTPVMHSTSTVLPSRTLLGPVGWVGRSVLAVLGYVGGVTLLALGAAGSVLWPRLSRDEEAAAPGFMKTLMHQLFWMLVMGVPLVGLVHIAMGSFLSLQAYYGSTFVEGTGAVVGVGLLRNLGGLMTGMTFAGILAARMIPELRILARRLSAGGSPSAECGSDRGTARWRQTARWRVRPGRDRAGPVGRPSDRRGRGRLSLALAMGHHGRNGGRLASVAVDDGSFDRDVLHDDAEDDVVPRRHGLDRQGAFVRRLAGGDLLLRGPGAGRPRGRARRRWLQCLAPGSRVGAALGDAGFPSRLSVVRGDSDPELELVHAGVSRGPLLRPDVAGAAGPVSSRAAASKETVPGREPR